MVRKCLIAGALALVALSVGKPASADPKFLEEYGDIFGARTLLRTQDVQTPGNALQGTAKEGKNHVLVISPFFRTADIGDSGDVSLWGGGIAYAKGSDSKNPWQVYFDFYNANIDPDFGGGEGDFFGWDFVGKFTVWGGYHTEYAYTGPIVSLFARYQDITDIGSRWDGGVAIDQRITDRVYVTANFGYADADPDGRTGGKKFRGGSGSVDDFVGGFGLTFSPNPRWSLSGNYVVDNDVDGDDFYSINLAYLINESFSARLGGGKDSTFFGNVLWRMR